MTTPDMRVGDSERDAALVSLGEHFAAGRLTHEEYDDRADAVLTARTVADLAALFEDLPDERGGGRTRRASGRRPVAARLARRLAAVPLVPAMVGLVVVSVVTGLPFFLLGIALWVLVPRRWPYRPYRHRRWGQASGSRRPAGGSWA